MKATSTNPFDLPAATASTPPPEELCPGCERHRRIQAHIQAGRTPWEGCWQTHQACAVARADQTLDELAAIKATLQLQEAKLQKAGEDLEQARQELAQERAARENELDAAMSVIEKNREQTARLKQQNEWMRAAHHLLANEEAFVHPKGGSPFFVMAEVSTEGLPMLSLNMSDTFYYACADAEPFRYEDAPMLLDIAKREGWGGLERWAAERRKERGAHHKFIQPIEDRIKREELARQRLEARIAELEQLAEVGRAVQHPSGTACLHCMSPATRWITTYACEGHEIEALQASIERSRRWSAPALRAAGIGEEASHG